jgi:hypothetical protein
MYLARPASKPLVDLNELHAKIGHLALEDDFLDVRSTKRAC